MYLIKTHLFLALASLAHSQLVGLTNCALPGPAYPPPDLPQSRVIKDTQASFAKLIENSIATGGTEWGPIGTANASFSLGVFSADSDDFLFEYHHRGTDLDDGTLTGGVLDADTLYRIGSVTKLLTVYALLATLDPSHWNEPITNFIPELANASTGNQVHHIEWSDITLDSLASHMSGIPRNNAFTDVSGVPGAENFGLPRLNSSDMVKCGLPGTPLCTREESIRLMLQQDPATVPWHTPVYSNEAFQLIGWACENITGKSMEEVFSTAIVEPLGLSRTFWSPPKNDSNANIVDLEPSLVSHLLGYEFEEGMGSYTPTGGVYTSLGDLSTIGRSILRSSLLSRAATRKWLKPVTHTASATTAIGKPWEISRMHVPVSQGSDRTRLVDLYAKNGGLSAYLTHLILSPDHGIGVTINVASKNAFATDDASDHTFETLSNLLVDKWVSAAETAAREEAGDNFSGTYVAEDGTDSMMVLALVPGRLGLTVQKLTYNGTDFFEGVGAALGFRGADLQFVGPRDEGQVAFRAVFSGPVAKDSGRSSPLGEACSGSWSGHGFFSYGNVGLDEVIISVDADGKGVAVDLPAFRTRLVKKAEIIHGSMEKNGVGYFEEL